MRLTAPAPMMMQTANTALMMKGTGVSSKSLSLARAVEEVMSKETDES